MQPEFTDDGILRKPGVHDGHFYGVVAEKGEVVKLMVKDYKNNPYVILLENVGSMNVQNFWGGDIILDVSLLPIEKAPAHMLQGLFKDRITEDGEIAKAIARDKRKYLFALESSYGADVYATCDGMQVMADAHLAATA
jgi:hypothetical protein